MINFKAEIEKFDANGEKTGWSYIFIPQALANQIKPGERRSMRVKGMIDGVELSGMSLMPMGEGDFIMALKSAIRKKIRKEAGAVVNVSLEHHADFKIEMPEDLALCLAQEEGALDYFMSFTKSHQNYFIVWLNTAKTEATRTKRLIMIVDAMVKKYNYAEMLRAGRKT